MFYKILYGCHVAKQKKFDLEHVESSILSLRGITASEDTNTAECQNAFVAKLYCAAQIR